MSGCEISNWDGRRQECQSSEEPIDFRAGRALGESILARVRDLLRNQCVEQITGWLALAGRLWRCVINCVENETHVCSRVCRANCSSSLFEPVSESTRYVGDTGRSEQEVAQTLAREEIRDVW